MNKNLIKVSSELKADGENILQNIIDNNRETLFLSSIDGVYPKDIYFEFSTEKVLERIDFFTNHPTTDSGKVTKYEILYKNKTSAKAWRSIYISNTYVSKGVRIAKFDQILAKEVCLRIHSSQDKVVAINDIEFYTREDLENKLLELFEEISCEKIKKNKLLKDIREFKVSNKDYKFIGELCEIGKYIRLNGPIENVKNLNIINPIENGILAEDFFKELKSNIPMFLRPLKVFLEKQKDLIILTDKSTDLYIINSFGKNINYKKIKLGSGLNIIYSKDLSGDLYLMNNNTNINISIYNPIESIHFKIGQNKFSDILKDKFNTKNIFVEGKNFNAYLNKEFLIREFNENEFVQAIENLDTIFNYIYSLMQRTDVYSQNILSFKIILAQGEASDRKPSCEKTEFGSYLSFANLPEKFFNKKIQGCINEEFCTVISELFFNEEILGSEVAKVLKSLLKQELHIRYLRNQPKIEDSTLNIWSKIRLIYGTERLIPKIVRGLSEASLDNLVLVASETLERDLSIYFKDVYELSQEIVEKCRKYPPMHIDINLVTYENQREYKLEEVRRFNEILKRN